MRIVGARLAGLCAIRRAQRQIRYSLRRRRNFTSSPMLVISIYPRNHIAAINRVPPLQARFVAASRAPRVPRRVALQVRVPERGRAHQDELMMARVRRPAARAGGAKGGIVFTSVSAATVRGL